MTRLMSRLALTLTLCTTLVAALGVTTASAADDLNRRVQAANEVLQDLQRIPEQAIPPNLLNRAYAVAVIPNVIKGGFIVGGSFGKGVLMVRRNDGAWSNPAFIKLANVGIGWQAGAQGADLVLVFKSRQGVDNIARGKFTLGGSASASAGPVGRTTGAMTDGEFKSEIYTYARSRGLFAGVSLDGGAITIDNTANTAWYGNSVDGAAARIFSDRSIATPPGARTLLVTLGGMAPPLNWNDAGQVAQTPAPAAPVQDSTDSKTYAVEDGAEPAPETKF
jgi:lipid-binding SYLF domain-containing protein